MFFFFFLGFFFFFEGAALGGGRCHMQLRIKTPADRPVGIPNAAVGFFHSDLRLLVLGLPI